jgi:flagellar transcriptional activator FlhD
MSLSNLTNEIRDLNLSFLLLAQSMLRADRAQALFRLGMSPDVADLLLQMSPQQLVRVASRNMTLCTLRFGDELVWSLLTDSHTARRAEEASNADMLHASVLMASAMPAQLAA